MQSIQRSEMPRDGNQISMQIVPPITALARTYNTSLSSAVQVNLNAGSTFVEVSAISAPIFMKYTTTASYTAVTTSNFDEYIGTGFTRHYQIPNGITALSFIEQTASAYLVLIEK